MVWTSKEGAALIGAAPIKEGAAMKVTLERDIRTSLGVGAVGDVVDLPEAEAVNLISGGKAVIAPSISNKKPPKTKPVAVAGNKGMMKHDLGV